jgi:hypothetical protein
MCCQFTPSCTIHKDLVSCSARVRGKHHLICEPFYAALGVFCAALGAFNAALGGIQRSAMGYFTQRWGHLMQH